MGIWKIIIDLQGDGENFWALLNTESNKWTLGGTAATGVFKTTNGSYKVRRGQVWETVFGNDEGAEDATFRSLGHRSSVNDIGTGYQKEAAINFDWKLESK